MIGEWLAIIMFAIFLVLILSGYPVAFSFAGTAVVFFILGLITDSLDSFVLNGLFSRWFGDSLNNFTFLAIPFFVFMGAVFEKSGLAERLLTTIGMLMGPLKGGMAVAVVFVVLAVWRGLSGWWLRGFAFAALLLAVANPSLQFEDREPLTDIVLLVVDESASQGIDVRPEQIAEAVADLEAEIADLDNTELRIVRMGDADGNRGADLKGMGREVEIGSFLSEEERVALYDELQRAWLR